MKINKAYKFRIYPDKKQIKYIEGCFNACRYVYNTSLDCEKQIYELWKFAESFGIKPSNELKKPGLSAFSLGYHLKQYKIKDQWLKIFDSLALEFEMDNLSKAYEKFFNGGGGYPKFKSKHDRKQSFRTRQKISIDSSGIKIPKVKTPIYTKIHREVEGVLKQMTISRENGNYYVSIMTELEKEVSPVIIKKEVGADWGVGDFLVLDNGEKIGAQNFLKNELEYLKILQQKLSRAKKGSNNREKIKKQIIDLYEVIRRRRENFLHKTSKALIEEYDRVYIEDLNVKGMTASASGTVNCPGKNVKQKSSLNRSILDSSPSSFANMLSYKAKFSGKEVVKVPKFYASSRICSNCGSKKDDLTLKMREWKCEFCGKIHDRDVNAAKNIKAEGQRSLILVK